jgi:hypothetical protein
MSTPPWESRLERMIHGVPISTAMVQEIEQALEMVRRVRTAETAKGKGEIWEVPGNKYELPDPVVYPEGASRDSPQGERVEDVTLSVDDFMAAPS